MFKWREVGDASAEAEGVEGTIKEMRLRSTYGADTEALQRDLHGLIPLSRPVEDHWPANAEINPIDQAKEPLGKFFLVSSCHW